MAMIQLWALPPDEYLTLIGRFIVAMNHAEAYLKQLLWKMSGIGHEMGALLTGGTPQGDISWILRKLYDKHATNQLLVDDIESILTETADLKLARDHMAHRQWHVEPHGQRRGVILSHRVLAKTAESVEETPYSIPDLEALCIRAHVLSGRILRHLVQREAVSVIENNWHGQYTLPPAPWLDKSSPREDTKGKNQKTSQKRDRPRRS